MEITCIASARGRNKLFQLLLWTQLVGVSTLSLSTVGGSWRQSGVALSAHRLLTVVLRGQSLQGRLDDAASQAQHQVEGRLLLDVVVGQRSAVLQLLASKDQTLLVWRNALLVLDLGLDIVDGVGRFDLQGDGLTG